MEIRSKLILFITLGIVLFGSLIYMNKYDLTIQDILPFFQKGIIAQSTSGLVATYTFTDTTNNKAYNRTSTTNQTAARLTFGTELPATGYTAINSNNNVNASCVNAGNSDYCMFRYVFNLNQSESDVSRVNITWIGAEDTDDTNIQVRVFNWTSNTWTFVGTVTAAKVTLTLNLSGVNVQNHIGDSNNNVTIIVDNPSLLTDGGTESVDTDFVKLDVLYTDNNPKWFSNTTNGTVAGTYILHSVNLTDDLGLSGYIFEFNNGTSYSNDTFVVATGTQNWANVSKWINTNPDTSIAWRVYFNDSLNQVNSTSLFNYTTTSAPTDCWTYDSIGKMLIIPTGCVYSLSSGGMQGI